MKVIKVRQPENDKGSIGTISIIREAASVAVNGMNITQMRSRIRILDAIEEAKNNKELFLEDADYSTLSEAINSMQWVRADKFILSIIDDILNAKTHTPDVDKPAEMKH